MGSAPVGIVSAVPSQAPTADGDSDTHFVVCGRKGFCWFENSEKNEEKSGSDSGLADKSDNSDHGSGDISHKSWSWSRPSKSLDDSGSGSADGSADSSDDDDSSSFPADNSELHEVRCCSDVQLPGWSKKFWCDVYAKSVFDKQCFHKKNYTTAEAICTDNNGRLCTKEELEQNCAAGTGCGHDFDFIWSSTPSDPTEMPTVVPSKLPSVSPSVIPSISLLPSLLHCLHHLLHHYQMLLPFHHLALHHIHPLCRNLRVYRKMNTFLVYVVGEGFACLKKKRNTQWILNTKYDAVPIQG